MELCQVSILKVRVEQFKCSLPQNLNMLITFFAHHCFFYFLGGWLYSSSSKLFLVVSTRISLCLKNLYFTFMLDHGLTKSRRVDGHFTLEYWHVQLLWDFPIGASGKEPACQCRRHKRHRFGPSVGKIPCRRAWPPTPVFLPGEFHGQRSLATVHRVTKSQTWLKQLCTRTCIQLLCLKKV